MTMAVVDLGEELLRWTCLAGYEVSDTHDGRVIFFNAGGELRIYLERLESGWIRVTTAERAGNESWLMEAANSEVLEKWLTVYLGGTVRGLLLREGMVVMPGRFGEVRGGFHIRRITETTTGSRREISFNGRSLAVFGGYQEGNYEAVQFSRYWERSNCEIRDSFLDPTGRPLFEPLTNLSKE